MKKFKDLNVGVRLLAVILALFALLWWFSAKPRPAGAVSSESNRSTNPGASELTRMPCGARARAIERVTPSTPVLVAA